MEKIKANGAISPRWRLLLMMGLFTLCPSTFAQDSVPVLPENECVGFYSQGEYEKAVDCLNNFLYTSGVTDKARLEIAYAHLGVCLMMLDKKPLARAAFTKLLELNPEYDLDPNKYLPDVLSMFQIIKFEKKAAASIVVPAYAAWMNLMPGAVPQFKNRERVKAGIILGTQVLALGLSLYAYNKEQALNLPEYGYREEDLSRARTFDKLHKGALIIFSLSYIIGMADGLINKRVIIKAAP
jgi:tetratricopeptide (TPR) repeat protein